jgi:hypothetical protein
MVLVLKPETAPDEFPWTQISSIAQMRSHMSVMYLVVHVRPSRCVSLRWDAGPTNCLLVRPTVKYYMMETCGYRVIVRTKHSKTHDKSITIFFQTTKYFHRISFCHSRNPSSNNYSTMHSLRPKYGEVSCSRRSHDTTKGITTYTLSKYRTHIKFTWLLATWFLPWPQEQK